jgi:hypothetical protein
VPDSGDEGPVGEFGRYDRALERKLAVRGLKKLSRPKPLTARRECRMSEDILRAGTLGFVALGLSLPLLTLSAGPFGGPV